MVKVTKKPVSIEAYQYVGPDELTLALNEGNVPRWLAVAWDHGKLNFATTNDKVLIQSDTHGEIVANPTDWIMYGVEGELYPCKDSVFHTTYNIDGVVDIRDPNPELS